MSGRRVKYSPDTKKHEGYLFKMHSLSRTRRELNDPRIVPEGTFDLREAENLVEKKYRPGIYNSEFRKDIAKLLVGKPKKISNVRPNQLLLESRIDDLMDLEVDYFFDKLSKEQYLKEASDTILAGGSAADSFASRHFE